MLAAVDIETESFLHSARSGSERFILGSLVREDGVESVFDSPQAMEQEILRLGAYERRRGHNLYVYGHNHEFDFYGYASLKDPAYRYVSLNPFYVTHGENPVNKRPWLYFLDTWALSHCTLEKLGSILGIPKGGTPSWLKDGTSKADILEDFEKTALTRQYCLQDSRISLRYMVFLRETLAKDGIHARYLISLPMLSRAYLNRFLLKNPVLVGSMLQDVRSKSFYPPLFDDELCRGVHGASVRVFQTGAFRSVSGIDCNSLYPYVASKMPLPDLRRSFKVMHPPDIRPYLSKIGIARVLLRKPADYGLVPVRYRNSLVFPTHSCEVLATFTLFEVAEFLKRGCTLLAIDYVVYYEQIPNMSLEPFFRGLYNRRKEGIFQDFHYKNIPNFLIGKLLQHRRSFDLRYASVCAESDMRRLGYRLSNFEGDLGVYRRDKEVVHNGCYCPVIPAYVYAMGRLRMYDLYRKLPYKNLVYSDTDSLVFTGRILKGVRVSPHLGDYKVIVKGKDAYVYGKKAARWGEDIRLSRVSKGMFAPGKLRKAFDAGIVPCARMRGLSAGPEQAGVFDTFDLDLDEQQARLEAFDAELAGTALFIDDAELKDLGCFLPLVGSVGERAGG